MSLFDTLRKTNPPQETPDVSEMLKSGMSEQDVIEYLRQQGYDNSTIKDALIKATAKVPDVSHVAEPTPPQTVTVLQPQSVPQMLMPQQQEVQQAVGNKPLSNQALDTIQAVLEQIIEEKWQAASSDLSTMRADVKGAGDSMQVIDDKINKLSQRVDGMQNVLMGKTEDYNKTLMDVNVELQAIEKIMSGLVPALADSMKELRSLIDEFKKGK